MNSNSRNLNVYETLSKLLYVGGSRKYSPKPILETLPAVREQASPLMIITARAECVTYHYWTELALLNASR